MMQRSCLSMLLMVIMMTMMMMKQAQCRTCICAQFLQSECEAEENCQWNEVVPSNPNTNGHKGICRSLRFMQCHGDPDCTLASRDPRGDDVSSTQKPLLSAHGMLRGDAPQPGDQTNGVITPSEEDDYDWPWNCLDNGNDNDDEEEVVYAEYVVNVKHIDQATRQLAVNLEQAGMTKQQVSNERDVINLARLSFADSLQTVAGLSFLAVLIAAGIYYKCKRQAFDDYYSQKAVSLQDNDYSTFPQTA